MAYTAYIHSPVEWQLWWSMSGSACMAWPFLHTTNCSGRSRRGEEATIMGLGLLYRSPIAQFQCFRAHSWSISYRDLKSVTGTKQWVKQRQWRSSSLPKSLIIISLSLSHYLIIVASGHHCALPQSIIAWCSCIKQWYKSPAVPVW